MTGLDRGRMRMRAHLKPGLSAVASLLFAMSLAQAHHGDADQFGFAVAISDDGDTVAVSANLEDSAATGVNGDQADNSVRDAGAVFVHRLPLN